MSTSQSVTEGEMMNHTRSAWQDWKRAKSRQNQPKSVPERNFPKCTPLVYLGGPMSGVPDYNFPHFREAAENLRSKDIRVISPAELDEERGIKPDPNGMALSTDEWAVVMLDDLARIVHVDAVVVLPGWENSKGASIEVQWARALSIPVFAYADFPSVPLAPEPRG